MSHSKEFLTLEEAVEYLHQLQDEDLHELDSEIDIIQLPPDESGNITDEENIDENILETVVPSDVCGKVIVSMNQKERELPADNTKKRKVTHNWKKMCKFSDSFPQPTNEIIHISDKFPELLSLEPYELFKKILPDQYITHLASLSTLYASQKGRDMEISSNDIKQFLGLILLSGYHNVPQEDMYWGTAEDISVPVVSSVMPRQKFRDIKKNFHLIDNNNLQQGDKLGKITPFYEELNKNVQQFGIFHQCLSIDESMVPYYGHHSCKMFIKGKPIRFGYKIWMLCSHTGYPYYMKIYGGKCEQNKSSPLGTRVVEELLSIVPHPLQVEVFFDNFFTSYDLLKSLKEKGLRATGTVREGRTGKCPVIPIKEMKKKERGEFDFRCDGDVYICRWNDNSVVTLGSNYSTHEPIGTTKRFSRSDKKRINVIEPNLVKHYNNGMGGVDTLDQLLSSYRPRLRNKKWWWNLFSNGLNLCVVASWKLFEELHGKNKKNHLEFRREVTMHLLKSNPRVHSRPGPRVQPSLALRKTDRHYLLEARQGRCACCKKNCRLKCWECEKNLHLHCFPIYHKIED